MKPIILIPLFLSCSMSLLFGQQENLPLHDKKFSFEIEQEKSEGKRSESSTAYYYTYIGKYRKAIENYELPLDWGFDTLSYKDSLDFLKYKPFHAFNYLKERTKDEKIVIISEAHQKPQHRVFTTELLEILYENGFRYLGLETLTPGFGDSTKFLMDTALMKRGYPLNSPLTGMYSREPQMGNLIRKALELGFVIFGYEKTNGDNERDLQQAINIEEFINRHPGGKTVIHCGWYHAVESSYPKRKSDNYMAFHLKNRTGIDPFTIYQDVLTEKVLIDESPYFRLVHSDQISILSDGQGNVFNGFTGMDHFDVLIYHPGTTFHKNRPDWLTRMEGTQFVDVERNRISDEGYPVIIEAFPEGEENSVPMDCIELLTKDDETVLILQKGDYTIRVTDKDRNVTEYEKAVE